MRRHRFPSPGLQVFTRRKQSGEREDFSEDISHDLATFFLGKRLEDEL